MTDTSQDKEIYMANTTFNGPVRSQNGFKTIIKDANSGALTNQMTLETYVATITVANGATTGKETAGAAPLGETV